MKDERTSKTYNLFIGKSKDWEYIFLEEAFKYGRDWMKGLTWSTFEFLTGWDLDERIDDYDWMELRREAVAHWNCTKSYRDWVKEVKRNWNAKMIVRDDSYCNKKRLQNAMDFARQYEVIDYEYSDCRWWWRMFDEENIKEDYYKYFIPENLEFLQEQYKEFEKI